MKNRLILALVLVLAMTLTACVPGLTAHMLDTLPETTRGTEPAATTQEAPVQKETQPQEPAQTDPTQGVDANPAENFVITEAEAKAIALADAGFDEAQVSRLRAEFDRDDGIPEYDVEFTRDGWEYEYEIHAESGKILHADKEWDN